MILKLNIKRIIYSVDNDFICIKPNEYTTDHVSQGNRFICKLSENKTK